MRNQPYNPQKGRSGLFCIFLLLIIVAGSGIAMRLQSSRALKEETKASAVTQVSVITPKQGPVTEELVLPSNVVAWHEASIYARTNGYVKKWYTPMGTRAKEGDLLAEIETPEIDAQLRQAEADLKTAEANYNLAQLTAKRWVALRKTDSVSKQDADEKIGDAKAKEAALASAQANRDHLKELQGFKQVRAPFDGVISARTTDIGTLVSEGSQTAQPLFHIVQADRLRVYTRVPQNDAMRINSKVESTVYFADHPGQPFPAKFVKTAEAIEQASRTMLIEYMLINKDAALLAGGYAESHFKLGGIATAIRLPVNTLIFRAEGLQIAIVGPDNKVSLRKITMGRDFGNEVEVTAGIAADDRVVINPPDSLFEGQEVRVTEPRKEAPKDGDAKPADAPESGGEEILMRHRFTIAFLLLTSACSFAPDYERPAMPVPETYKESADWAEAQPQLADESRGPWWKLFNDPILDGLEEKASVANQDLAASVARYDQARAAADVARSGLFPQINATGGMSRQRFSKNMADIRQAKPYNDYTLGADLSWELDLWGRLRNMAKAGQKRADASAADLAAMDLEIHAELAETYFALRGADLSQKILDEAVADYGHALTITKNRHDGGIAAGGEVDQVAAQLHNAETLAADNRLNRAQLEHALALLDGDMPSGFTVAPVADYKLDRAPVVATCLPSQLLEQRPDIAAGAYRVAAANADIGVARAAFFPTITLGLSGGVESAITGNLFKADSEFWALGPAAFSQPIFDGGRIAGLTDEAKAARAEAVANYRGTVLAAFGQVEDSLAANRELAVEITTQHAAAASAGGALAQAENLYKGGLTTYLDVVVAQNIALQAELDDANIVVRRANASVDLIRALGGGWKGNADY